LIFLLTVIIVLIGYSLLLFRNKETKEYSKIILVALIISILSNLALLENYMSSLINQKLGEGIGISNVIAYLIIREDGWSIDVFHKFYNNSLVISVILLFIYVTVLLIEQIKHKLRHKI